MYIQAGTTVRLTCKFYDPNGFLTTPTSVKLTFYDYRYQIISEINLNATNTLEEGVYFYDYTTDAEEMKYIFEWHGMIDGFPSIKRDSFTTLFI